MKKRILFIGKNSLLANQLYQLTRKKFFIKKISYEDFLNLSIKSINQYSHIINFAIKKKYILNKYNVKDDLDFSISKKLIEAKCIFVFLSSRKVYKATPNIKETDKIYFHDNYGRNKFLTENKLRKLLKKNLLILRISNVLTYKNKKVSKQNRRSHKTFLDYFYEIRLQKKKYYTFNYFKDFITIDQLSRYFISLIKIKITGTFNISLGKKIFIKEIFSWIDKSFLKRVQFVKKPYNKHMSFVLNNSKILKLVNLKITKKQVENFCIKNLSF